MEHPITPPPELVQQWFKQAHESADPANQLSYYDFIATAAAQWGADQELEACCEQTDELQLGTCYPVTGDKLRAARRPKPPSLKEQALAAAARFYAKGHEDCTEQEVRDDYDALCRALGVLPG